MSFRLRLNVSVSWHNLISCGKQFNAKDPHQYRACILETSAYQCSYIFIQTLWNVLKCLHWRRRHFSPATHSSDPESWVFRLKLLRHQFWYFVESELLSYVSVAARDAMLEGDLRGAKHMGKWSLWMSIVGVILTVVLVLILIILLFTGVIWNAAFDGAYHIP